jgi:hypothetical protein
MNLEEVVFVTGARAFILHWRAESKAKQKMKEADA